MELLITSDHNQLYNEEIVVKAIEQSTFHRYIYLAYDKTRKPSELAEKSFHTQKRYRFMRKIIKEEPMLSKNELHECPVATTVQIIRSKWKLF